MLAAVLNVKTNSTIARESQMWLLASNSSVHNGIIKFPFYAMEKFLKFQELPVSFLNFCVLACSSLASHRDAY